MEHRLVINIFLLFFLVIYALGSMFLVAEAEGELMTGGQPAEETFNSIVQAVVGFFSKIGDFVGRLLGRLIDFGWWRDTIVGIFYTVDNWVYKIFGMNLGEIFGEIGKLLIAIFNLVIEFIKRLWPF